MESGENTIIMAAIYGVHWLTIVFPLLVLFGFFENRKNGTYHFRLRRFLITLLFFIIMNVITGIGSDYIIGPLVSGADHIAEIAVLKNRAVSVLQMDNQGAMFPNVMTPETKLCYRSGASNYVETLWDQSFREADCSNGKPSCIDTYGVQKQQDYYDAVRERKNPRHVIALDLHVMGVYLNSIWATAANVHQTIRRIYRTSGENGKISDPPDAHMLSDYRNFFNDCETLNPLPWAQSSGEILLSHSGFCVGRCP